MNHERIFVIDQIKEELEKLQTRQLLQLLAEIKKNSETQTKITRLKLTNET
jgi:uncharacterized Zn finger protein